MLVLGIESSCDETAAALVDEFGRVHADVIQSQVALHAPYGGIVPELASRDHVRNVAPVVRAALVRAGRALADIDGVAVTNRPGLVGALLVGVQTAKGIAWAADKPIVGVDHLMGHLLSAFLRREAEDAPAPSYPFVSLLASGGHTAIYRVDAPRADAIVELGATRDDAAGEAFDKVAKLLGLGYPGGPRIDRLAALGNASRIKLSAPMAARDSLDMSFSGIKTQVARMVAKRETSLAGGNANANGDAGNSADDSWVRDLCAAFQASVTGVLARKAIEAATRERVSDIVLGGGVAANSELRKRMCEAGVERGIRVLLPTPASCTDNAAMIAYAGSVRLMSGEHDGWDLAVASRTALQRRTRTGRGKR